MNMRVYELYVGPLSAEEKDRYCAEASVIETGLGIPAGTLPRTALVLGQYMSSMVSSGQITVTDTARMLASSVLHPRMPHIARPALSLVRLATVGLLPATIRDDYGFTWNQRKETMFRRSAVLIRNVVRVTPRFVRHWPAARRAATHRWSGLGHSSTR
jgi:uncharacterized protein (DUF2236 family)